MKTPFAFAVLFSGALTAVAAGNLLTNGSFESGAFVDTGGGYSLLSPGSTAITGWTTTQGDLVWGGPFNVDTPAPDGSHFLELTSYGAGWPLGGLEQTIGTTAGLTYHFSVTLFDPFDPGSLTAEVHAGLTSMILSASGGFDFVATGPSTTIRILGNDGGSFLGVDGAAVTLVSDVGVPEMPVGPTTLGLGLLAAYAWQRRLKAKASVQ